MRQFPDQEGRRERERERVARGEAYLLSYERMWAKQRWRDALGGLKPISAAMAIISVTRAVPGPKDRTFAEKTANTSSTTWWLSFQ